MMFGYPFATKDGETIHKSTHFLTEAEAWESIRAEVSAVMKVAGERVRDAKANLAEAERAAGAAAEKFAEAMRGYEQWKSREDKGD